MKKHQPLTELREEREQAIRGSIFSGLDEHVQILASEVVVQQHFDIAEA